MPDRVIPGYERVLRLSKEVELTGVIHLLIKRRNLVAFGSHISRNYHSLKINSDFFFSAIRNRIGSAL